MVRHKIVWVTLDLDFLEFSKCSKILNSENKMEFLGKMLKHCNFQTFYLYNFLKLADHVIYLNVEPRISEYRHDYTFMKAENVLILKILISWGSPCICLSYSRFRLSWVSKVFENFRKSVILWVFNRLSWFLDLNVGNKIKLKLKFSRFYLFNFLKRAIYPNICRCIRALLYFSCILCFLNSRVAWISKIWSVEILVW